jgi:hypothetical protein
LPKGRYFSTDLSLNSPLHDAAGMLEDDEKDEIIKLLLEVFTPEQILQKNVDGDNFLHIFLGEGGSMDYISSLIPGDLFSALVSDKNLKGETPEDQIFVYQQWKRKLIRERRITNFMFG